jgi:hypothetical protein
MKCNFLPGDAGHCSATVLNGAVSTRRGVWVLAIAFVALLINLPVAHSWWMSNRLDKDGVIETARVVDAQALPKGSDDPQRFFITYTLPESADPDGREFTAEIDRETFEVADASKEIEVLYLEDQPSANRVQGSLTSNIGYWLAGFADLGLIAAMLLALRFGLRPEQPLTLLASADVVRCKPDFAVEEQEREGDYVVRGDIMKIEDGEIVLHAGAGREVRVLLGEYANPVGYQQPAEVRGRVLPERPRRGTT